MEHPNDANSERIPVRYIEDLEDANLAGTKESQSCTLILTDGHVAKSLAIAGISEIDKDRDRYGVYPLLRPVINASSNKKDVVKSNNAVKDLVDILNLSFSESSEAKVNLGTLRYGHVMLMMNRDEEGSRRKCLLINLFRCYWPDLFRSGFIQQFITPVVKVFHGNEELLFYSYKDFKCRSSQNRGFEDCPIKQYKSLECFTSTEIKNCFRSIDNHRVSFIVEISEDNDSFLVCFEKRLENRRKEWMKKPEEPLSYTKGMHKITCKDFIDKEFKFYCKLKDAKSFPSVIDGLTHSERNVLHTCLEKWADQEVNVLALINSVLEGLAYTRGTESLGQAIINMAQDFVGKNNMNLLTPLGQFGTRLRGGEDAGNVENLHIKLQDFAKVLFSVRNVTEISKNRNKSGILTDPWDYFPILPMILVNTALEDNRKRYNNGILSYHPKDIIKNIRLILSDEEPLIIEPWFRNFTGKIERTGVNEFCIYGKVSKPVGDQIDITELPIGRWTQDYKRDVLEYLLDKRSEPQVVRYTEHHTDTSVHFRVTLDRIPPHFEDKDFLDFFELFGDITETLVALDRDNCKREYTSVNELLKEYCNLLCEKYKPMREERKAKLQQQHDELEKKLKEKNQSVSLFNRNELLKTYFHELHDYKMKIEQLRVYDKNAVLTMWKDDINELKKFTYFQNLLQ